jgi:hypothetical protein
LQFSLASLRLSLASPRGSIAGLLAPGTSFLHGCLSLGRHRFETLAAFLPGRVPLFRCHRFPIGALLPAVATSGFPGGRTLLLGHCFPGCPAGGTVKLPGILHAI